jgi:hypothetical protein
MPQVLSVKINSNENFSIKKRQNFLINKIWNENKFNFDILEPIQLVTWIVIFDLKT